MDDVKFYVSELRSEQCQCSRSKKPGKSFCFRCWKMLPPEIQAALYRRIGEGYEEAYDRALVEITGQEGE